MARIKTIGGGLRLYVREIEKRTSWNHFQKVRRMFNLIARRTPVYTGTLRFNWTASYDRITTSNLTINETPLAPLPPASFTLQMDKENARFRTVVIANRIQYIKLFEYGGWSDQAPQGVVRIAMREVFGA